MAQAVEKSSVIGIERPAATSIVAVIERAAMNPNVDIDKMERLLEMQERILAQQAAMDFAADKANMQPCLPVIRERGKIDIGRGKPQSYALWEDVVSEITPVLSEHGFTLGFRTGSGDNSITVTAILGHRSGHSEETSLSLPHDTSGSKNAVQAMGSTVSYGKRYTASALLNLVFTGEDDDGKSGGHGEKVSEEQLNTLIAAADEVGADKDKFCKFYKVASFADISAANYGKALAALQAKKGKDNA